MRSKYKILEYLNKKINKWTILSFSHVDSKGQQYWLCKCECGLEKPVRTSHLIRSLNKGCTYCRSQAARRIDSPNWLGGKFIPKSMFTSCLLAAKSRKIRFELTMEDLEDQWIEQKGKCAYTNIELTLPLSNCDRSFNASLDRINSSKPYVKENIQWVLKEVNLMKMNISHGRFLELCKIISNK